MVVFATLVEAGSMRRAGSALGISTSAVSQQVAKLERDFKVVLLHRTTRRFVLTEAGEAFYRDCRQVRDAAHAARERLLAAREAPEGELVVSAPSMLAEMTLPLALAPLLRVYRRLNLRLLVADERFDLVDSKVDIAIVVGRVPDSTLVGHLLATWQLILCASPAYLAERGVPLEADDLGEHDLLGLAQDYIPESFTLEDAEGREALLMWRARHLSTSQSALRRMAIDGLGVSVQAREEVDDELRLGGLVRVLPQWIVGRAAVRALTWSRSREVPKVRLALDTIRRFFAKRATDAASTMSVHHGT